MALKALQQTFPSRKQSEAREQTVQGHHGPSVVCPMITDVERADPTSFQYDASSAGPRLSLHEQDVWTTARQASPQA